MLFNEILNKSERNYVITTQLSWYLFVVLVQVSKLSGPFDEVEQDGAEANLLQERVSALQGEQELPQQRRRELDRGRVRPVLQGTQGRVVVVLTKMWIVKQKLRFVMCCFLLKKFIG